jgi:two-component system, cell cycle response regulator DivK
VSQLTGSPFSARDAQLVMVVDDAEDIRAMLRFVLDSRGYRVVEASNGHEAVMLARTECPDLILMDLSMPVLDGFGAVRGIREVEELCDVPVVAISAHNTQDHRAKALAVGFNDYLTKPIDFSRLSNLIQRFLQAA